MALQSNLLPEQTAVNLEKLKKAVDEIVSREPAVRGRGEQATKQALVFPMLAALEYEMWNPAEVCPEYDADFAIQSGAPARPCSFSPRHTAYLGRWNLI